VGKGKIDASTCRSDVKKKGSTGELWICSGGPRRLKLCRNKSGWHEGEILIFKGEGNRLEGASPGLVRKMRKKKVMHHRDTLRATIQYEGGNMGGMQRKQKSHADN